MLECISAPNRYRKMNPEKISLEEFKRLGFIDHVPEDKVGRWLAEVSLDKQQDRARDMLNEEIIARQREEFPDKGTPLGMIYSFDVCDEVLVWSKEAYQPLLGSERPKFIVSGAFL